MSLSLIFVGKIIPVSGENFWVQLFKNLIDFYAPTRLWKLIKYVDIFLAHSMRRNKYLASRKSFTYLSYILCIGLLYNDMRKPVTILRFIWKTIVKIKCLFLMLLYYAPCCARNNGMEFFLKSSFLTYMCLFAFRYCKILTINPSITDGVHRKENLVELIPVFSTFSNFFKKKEKKNIKAILCNFSMRLLKYF